MKKWQLTVKVCDRETRQQLKDDVTFIVDPTLKEHACYANCNSAAAMCEAYEFRMNPKDSRTELKVWTCIPAPGSQPAQLKDRTGKKVQSAINARQLYRKERKKAEKKMLVSASKGEA
jgi:hypothetical protein